VYASEVLRYALAQFYTIIERERGSLACFLERRLNEKLMRYYI
jgi:hypothetical protein